MRREHTSVRITQGDYESSHTPLNTLLWHVSQHSQPGAGHTDSSQGLFHLLALCFPAVSSTCSLTQGLLHTGLAEARQGSHAKVNQPRVSSGYTNPCACELAHLHTHRSSQPGESQQHSTQWNPSYQLELSCCYIYPTTTPETNALLLFPTLGSLSN